MAYSFTFTAISAATAASTASTASRATIATLTITGSHTLVFHKCRIQARLCRQGRHLSMAFTSRSHPALPTKEFSLWIQRAIEIAVAAAVLRLKLVCLMGRSTVQASCKDALVLHILYTVSRWVKHWRLEPKLYKIVSSATLACIERKPGWLMGRPKFAGIRAITGRSTEAR